MATTSNIVQEVVSLARCVFEISNFSGRWLKEERLKWLRELDGVVVGHKDEILKVVSQDLKTSEHSVLVSEYVVVRNLIRYYKKVAKGILNDENRSNFLSLLWGNRKTVVKKVPLGVVGIITPSNSPFSIPLGLIIPAILAGNAVVWKPSPQTKNTNRFLAKLLRSSFRDFEFSPVEVLPSDDKIGEEMVKNPEVDRIFFVGSARVGELIRQINAAVRSIPPVLELGGSNAAIVLEDADLEMAARVITWGRFGVISCNSIKRVYAPQSVYWSLLENLVDEVKKLRACEKAPIPRGQEERYTRFVDEYFSSIRFSKKRELLREHGFPTKESFYFLGILPVIEAAPFSFLREETFMPLLPVVCTTTEEEAVQLANHESFDLGAVVFTRNKEKFKEVANSLAVSTVVHNDAMIEFAMPSVPFGGGGKSGWGYVHGPEGLLEFVKIKTTIEERWQAPKFHLFPWTPAKCRFLRKMVDFILNLS